MAYRTKEECVLCLPGYILIKVRGEKVYCFLEPDL